MLPVCCMLATLGVEGRNGALVVELRPLRENSEALGRSELSRVLSNPILVCVVFIGRGDAAALRLFYLIALAFLSIPLVRLQNLL